MFEHRFLPLKNDDSFRNPHPLKDNHRVCDHNAMLAFPQERISHYTTEHDSECRETLSHLMFITYVSN